MRYFLFRPGYFGDTLVIFPLVIALQRAFPAAEIVFITNTHSAGLVRGGDVLSLFKKTVSVIQYSRENTIFDSIRALRAELKLRADDHLLYLPISGIARWRVVRDWIFFRLLGFKNIKGTAGYLNARILEGEREHERLFRVLAEEGVVLTLPQSIGADLTMGEFPQSMSAVFAPGMRLVAVCPGSKMQSKRWPIERFIEVLQTLASDDQVHFILIGSNEERQLGEEIEKHVPGRCSLAYGLPFDQLVALLRRASVYLGNDTGPMHLAALLDLPCVSIFSSRARPGLWYPFGANHQIFRHAIECEGCGRYVCHSDPAPCLLKTEVTAVLDSVREALLMRGAA